MTVPGGIPQDDAPQTSPNPSPNPETTPTQSTGSGAESSNVSGNEWQQPLGKLQGDFDSFRQEIGEQFGWLRQQLTPNPTETEPPSNPVEELPSPSEIVVQDREPPKRTGAQRAILDWGMIRKRLS